ncbi:uncharacterized protein LOC130726086 [Lotus japonicus]|uniref:uncharacterized protein LOC130726086 n=1 Tax=Lotus japonicus TaxID=34305 RepID=UPI0025833B40|nr:uncharacterized protein LOC130726086 [Lotus japonicus]
MAMEGVQNNPIQLSSDSEDDEIEVIAWDVPLTRHKASGKQALGIPARVVRACLMQRPHIVSVEIDGDYERLEDWDLLWTHDRTTQCMFGHGWYKYVVEKQLREGDEVSFVKHPHLLQFLVTITRREELGL